MVPGLRPMRQGMSEMGCVIGMLARIGGDASLRYAPAETLAFLLSEAAPDAELAAALDKAPRAAWFLTQIPPKPDRDVDDPFDDDDDDRHDDAPDGDDDDTGRQPDRRHLARLASGRHAGGPLTGTVC